MSTRNYAHEPPDILGIIQSNSMPRVRSINTGRNNRRVIINDADRDQLFRNGYSYRPNNGPSNNKAGNDEAVKLTKVTIANGCSSSTIYIGANPSSSATSGTPHSADKMNGHRCVDTSVQECHQYFGADENTMEHFYMNEKTQVNGNSKKNGVSANGDDEHPFFVGSRDVRNPDSLREMKIVSSRGTVRGYKNRVRAGIATFIEKQDSPDAKNYRILEKGMIVMYTTSMRIVRDTHDKCKRVKNILQTHMVQYEEKDIFMSRENQDTLMERLGTNSLDVPQVFADGQLLGNAEQLEQMNENGELRRIFKQFSKVSQLTSCEKCGGYQYIPCSSCHGSKKSLHRNHFTEEFCALRCTVCNENGLVRCDICSHL